MIGLLGEYISRIFEEVKQRPLWVVAQKQGFDELPPGAEFEMQQHTVQQHA
ncbi:MAG: hypothetical protein IT424_07570 [Pirellulales bacterium]|nr:hypothetical protein [Pirellulales bacterium]